jgi:hypothetical protein
MHGALVHGVLSQVIPLNPTAQLHENEFPFNEQLPPFLHGELLHGVTSQFVPLKPSAH